MYEVIYTPDGCCDAFTSVSNCYNPNSTALGTVTATPLVIGQDYMLMVDGQGGANCEFTIAGWKGLNILPVEMLNFYGYNKVDENLLTWTTSSELNNNYFIIEKSINGIDYIEIGQVKGGYNSTAKLNYEFSDEEINNSLVYYRLKQVDFDGGVEQIGEIKVTRELRNVVAYPNPATDNLTFTVNYSSLDELIIEFIDVQGKIIKEYIILNNSNSVQSILFPKLEKGLYFVRITDSNARIIETMKVVKN